MQKNALPEISRQRNSPLPKSFKTITGMFPLKYMISDIKSPAPLDTISSDHAIPAWILINIYCVMWSSADSIWNAGKGGCQYYLIENHQAFL